MLDNVKVGDAIAIYQSYGWDEWRLTKAIVTRATKTRVEAEKWMFNRRGNVPGSSSWSRTHAEPWNEATHSAKMAEFNAAERKRALVRKLGDRKWDEMSLTELEQIYALVREVK